MKLPSLSLSKKFGLFTILVFLIPFLTISAFLYFAANTGRPLDMPSLLPQIILLFLLNLALVLSAFLWILKGLIEPTKQIMAGGIYMNKGHYKYQIPVIGDDEIGQVAKIVNLMSYRLEDAISQNQAYKNQATSEKNRLILTLSSLEDAVITLDDNLIILFTNKSAEKLTQLPQNQAIGKKFSQLFHLIEGGAEIPEESYCPKTTNNFESGSFFCKAIKLTTPTKEVFVDVTSKQIKQGNQALGFIISMHDVTSQNQLEAMKLDFVSMAAHELRTPLTSIKGYLSVYLDENGKNLNPEQRMFLDRINISTQQLSALVENILSVAKIERGSLTITTAPLNWVEHIKQLVGDFVFRASAKRITITFTEPIIPIPQLEVDKIRITEVISNLLSNAVNYTDVGGTINVWLDLKDSKEVITHIKDTGVGLTPETAQHLFTKFYRVQGKLEGTMKGNGLGLYITKSIVEIHKGRIWAESEGLGKGSTFSFSLPIPQKEKIVKYNF